MSSQVKKGRNICFNFRAIIAAGATVNARFNFPVAEAIRISDITSIQSGGAVTDITISRIQLQRPDTSRREEIISDGTPSLPELGGPHKGLTGFLSALERLTPNSSLDMTITNTSAGALTISITLWGYTLTEEEEKEVDRIESKNF